MFSAKEAKRLSKQNKKTNMKIDMMDKFRWINACMIFDVECEIRQAANYGNRSANIGFIPLYAPHSPKEPPYHITDAISELSSFLRRHGYKVKMKSDNSHPFVKNIMAISW